MADFDITSPDGRKFRVTAPEGATQDDVLAYAKEQFAKMPKAAEPSFGSKLLNDYPGTGMGEAALSLGTGFAGQVAGGFSGLGTIATNALGLTDTPPGDRVRQVSDALTYEPRGRIGREITAGIAKPFELLARGADAAGGKVTDMTGSPAAGAAVNTAIQSAPMALGPLARAIPGESAASIAARAKLKSLNAPVDEGIATAREAGLSITPTQAEAGKVAKAAESLAGSERLQKAASKKNAPVINDIVRKDVGLPEDQPLTREALSKRIQEEGQHYEFVKNTGRIETDARYQGDLHNIESSYETAAKDFKHRSEKPFQKTVDGLRTDGFDAGSAVEEVKLLRNDADEAYRAGNKGLGKVYKQLSQAVDDQIDRHLQKISVTGDLSGDPAMASAYAEYKAARVNIAKLYAAHKALNDATGNINAAVYARDVRAKPGLMTGGAKQVADFAKQFPKAAQQAERLGPTGPTVFDVAPLLFGDIPLSVKGLLTGARPAGRSLMLTGPLQDLLTSPRTYGQPKIRSLQDLIEQVSAERGAAATATGQRQ